MQKCVNSYIQRDRLFKENIGALGSAPDLAFGLALIEKEKSKRGRELPDLSWVT